MKPFVYVKAPAEMTLEAFAALFRELFPNVALEERYSDNYYRGSYYRADLNQRRTTLSYASEEHGAEYPFWVAVGGPKDGAQAALVDSIAGAIASRGFAAFIPKEHVDDFSEGTRYEAKA